MDARDETPATAASAEHVPVLLDRVLAVLGPAVSERAAVVVDATSDSVATRRHCSRRTRSSPSSGWTGTRWHWPAAASG
jgi:hypothetical protein